MIENANAIVMILCFCVSLLLIMPRKKRQDELLESVKNIFIDAGEKSSDIYQCVNFARQYYRARTCVLIITYLIQDPIASIFDTLFGKENKCMYSVMLIQRHVVPPWYHADVT
jgi:hypothetical protein